MPFILENVRVGFIAIIIKIYNDNRIKMKCKEINVETSSELYLIYLWHLQALNTTDFTYLQIWWLQQLSLCRAKLTFPPSCIYLSGRPGGGERRVPASGRWTRVHVLTCYKCKWGCMCACLPLTSVAQFRIAQGSIRGRSLWVGDPYFKKWG